MTRNITTMEPFAIDDFKPVPRGFKVESPEQGLVIITYKRAGLRGMSFFLAAWLAGWTVVCLVQLFQFFSVGNGAAAEAVSFWSLALFWIAEFFFAGVLAYFLFGRKSFRLDQRNLVMQTTILGWKRTRSIERGSIRKFIQIKDWEDTPDSGPSWGLKVDCGQQLHVIRRHPYRISLWLGEVLAQWAGVEFRSASGE